VTIFAYFTAIGEVQLLTHYTSLKSYLQGQLVSGGCWYFGRGLNPSGKDTSESMTCIKWIQTIEGEMKFYSDGFNIPR
jgi:hypothetical protein